MDSNNPNTTVTSTDAVRAQQLRHEIAALEKRIDNLDDHGRSNEIPELALQQAELEAELNEIENRYKQDEILLQLSNETPKKKERRPRFGPLIVFAHDLSNPERGGWGDYVSHHDNRMIAQNQLQSVARRCHVFKAWIVDMSTGVTINTLQKPWTTEQIAAMSVNLKTIV